MKAVLLAAAFVAAAASSWAATAAPAAGGSMEGFVNVLPAPAPAAPRASADGMPQPSEKRLPYLPFIREASRRHGVDPALVEAVIACESNFQPTARSKAGAMGLMQLMPSTARKHGCTDPLDVRGNIDAGARHLAELLAELDGDRRLAIAAYNAGLGAVKRAGGVPPFTETRRYVRKVETYLARLQGGDEPAEGTSAEPAPAAAPPAPKGPPLRLVRDSRGRLLITNLALPESAAPAESEGGAQ